AMARAKNHWNTARSPCKGGFQSAIDKAFTASKDNGSKTGEERVSLADRGYWALHVAYAQIIPIQVVPNHSSHAFCGEIPGSASRCSSLPIFFPSLGRRSPRMGGALSNSRLISPILTQARRRLSANCIATIGD